MQTIHVPGRSAVTDGSILAREKCKRFRSWPARLLQIQVVTLAFITGNEDRSIPLSNDGCCPTNAAGTRCLFLRRQEFSGGLLIESAGACDFCSPCCPKPLYSRASCICPVPSSLTDGQPTFHPRIGEGRQCRSANGPASGVSFHLQQSSRVMAACSEEIHASSEG